MSCPLKFHDFKPTGKVEWHDVTIPMRQVKCESCGEFALDYAPDLDPEVIAGAERICRYREFEQKTLSDIAEAFQIPANLLGEKE